MPEAPEEDVVLSWFDQLSNWFTELSTYSSNPHVAKMIIGNKVDQVGSSHRAASLPDNPRHFSVDHLAKPVGKVGLSAIVADIG